MSDEIGLNWMDERNHGESNPKEKMKPQQPRKNC